MSTMAATAKMFRNQFKIAKERITWYPGHMKQSFKHMQAVMRKVDCVLEVHDSRIPFSGRNPKFLWSLIGTRPHILVLNKRDLIDESYCSDIRQRCFEDNCENVIFTNCLNQNCRGLHSLIPTAVKLTKNKGFSMKLDSSLRMMVVGVPNVGKSSLINALRSKSLAKGKAAQVGAEAGITRAVQTQIKVHSDPEMFLIDTPGILTPKISDIECGMKLALCACLNDSVVGVDAIADFLLYWMNKTNNFIYVDYFGLKEPIDEVFPLLLKIAFDNKFTHRIKNFETNLVENVPDTNAAALTFVKLFRKGKFGDLFLDKNYLTGAPDFS